MRRLFSTCAGLTLAFGLSGCAQQTGWICEVAASRKSADVIDPTSKAVVYTADTLQHERHPYIGVTTYTADNLRAADPTSWSPSGTVTLYNSHLTITTHPDSLKIESCVIHDPGKGSFRAASGQYAKFAP